MAFFLEVVLLRNKLTPIPPKNVLIKYLSLPLDTSQIWNKLGLGLTCSSQNCGSHLMFSELGLIKA